MKKFYLDTSVWRDYFEDRRDNIRPLGEFAFQFLKCCREKKYIILYSKITLIELNDFQKELIEFFNSFEDIALKVSYSKEQVIEANNIEKHKTIPYNDALHAIFARDNNAILIKRDKHFEDSNSCGLNTGFSLLVCDFYGCKIETFFCYFFCFFAFF